MEIVQTLPQLRQRKDGQAPLSDFRKNSWYREIQKEVKDVMASLRCHGNYDVNQTSNHNNISSLIVQHSCGNFSEISVNGNVVNAQT